MSVGSGCNSSTTVADPPVIVPAFPLDEVSLTSSASANRWIWGGYDYSVSFSFRNPFSVSLIARIEEVTVTTAAGDVYAIAGRGTDRTVDAHTAWNDHPSFDDAAVGHYYGERATIRIGYTRTSDNVSGSVSATATVQHGPQGPVLRSFTVSPNPALIGRPATISWIVESATSVHLATTLGSSFNGVRGDLFDEDVEISGNRTFTPPSRALRYVTLTMRGAQEWSQMITIGSE